MSDPGSRFCPKCGAQLASPQSNSGTKPAWYVWSPPIGTTQPNLFSSPEYDCGDACDVWEVNFRSIQSSSETNPAVGFSRVTEANYIETQEMTRSQRDDRKSAAEGRAAQGGWTRWMKSPESSRFNPKSESGGNAPQFGGRYRSHEFRYFFRKSEFSGVPNLKVFQMTYVNTITHQKQTRKVPLIHGESYTEEIERTYHYYPPSPMTNFVVCPIRGRISGEFAITSRFAEFFANQSRLFSQSMLADLNLHDFAQGLQSDVHTLAQAARLLFALERDLFQDSEVHGWKQRQGAHRGFRFGFDDLFVESRYDEYFMSTLLDSDLFNVENWPNYPKTRHGVHLGTYSTFTASEAEKHFFVMLTPYKDWTIFMANYPAYSTFGRQGELMSSNLSMDWVLWLIRGVCHLLTNGANLESPTEAAMAEKHRYWSIVGQPDERRHPVGQNTGFAFNLPVVPFQDALTFIEAGGRDEPPKPERPVAKVAVKTCKCGARLPTHAESCPFCGEVFPAASEDKATKEQ